jgi:hypothetical protein
MEVEHRLRTTSDELLHRLERLRELELEKRQLTPGTQRFQALVRDIEQLAAAVLTKTVEQEELAEQAIDVREATGVDPAPIADVSARREVSVILGEWREAERRLSAAAPGTAQQLEAQASVDRLRAEYREAYSAVSGRPDEGR